MDRKFHLMVTPKVVEEVRAHFDCPDLEGAELEDQVMTDH
jgi:leishmanolysin-like peptidase